MKTLRFIGMAIVAIIISVNFAACSDDDEDDNNPLIGTWINSEGNATMTWTFKANGTGVEKYDDNEAGSELHEVYSFTYTYDINALLEVEAKIVSTGETVTRLIKNQENSMTEEEMKARMRELSYLKIPPREQEKNKVLLLRGERLYEETTGELREQLEMVTQQFERILDRQDPLKIEEARKDYEEALDWIEEEMWI